jgi:subtilase family serine protease
LPSLGIRPFVAAVLTVVLFSAAAARAGSASPFAPARVVAAASPAQAVDFIVHLPLRNRAELEELVVQQADPASPLYQHFLTPAQFAEAFGPSATTRAAALAFLRANGFAVTSIGTQVIGARGAAAYVARTFGVHLVVATDLHGRNERVVSRENAIRVPAALAALGAHVVGITATPERRSQARTPRNRQSPLGGYWFDDLKQAYDYPSYEYANGRGVKIATFGVSDFSDSDATLYFNHERLGGAGALAPAPVLQHLKLAGYTPFDPNNGDSFEANLDIQQEGGSAPGATVIGISQANTDAAFISGYAYVDDHKIASIVSTSYGQCELLYTAAYNDGVDETSILNDYDDAFVQGNAEGISFLESSGDNGGLDCPQVGYFGPPANGRYVDVKGVESNADDPHVTDVGGTNLVTTYTPGSLRSSYVSENALADLVGVDDPYGTGNVVTNELWGSGGGTSVIFAQPSYQLVDRPRASGRLMPDVSMHMGGCPSGAESCNPEDSYVIEYLGGVMVGAIGTSASSPEFAGLLAVAEGVLGKPFGNVNVQLDSLAAANARYHEFHQGIPGNNGVVTVKAGTTGWNQIVGVGTPETDSLIPAAPVAGNPQTASNP